MLRDNTKVSWFGIIFALVGIGIVVTKYYDLNVLLLDIFPMSTGVFFALIGAIAAVAQFVYGVIDERNQ